MPSVADLVDPKALDALAGDQALIDAGDELLRTDDVTLIEFGPQRVVAEVRDGGGAAMVELASVDGALSSTCDCSDGVEGRFCRHAFAVGRVTWEKSPKRRP